MKHIYVVGNSIHYADFIDFDFELTSDKSKADLAIFTGGEDVSPSLYNEKKNVLTYCNIARDNKEMKEFEELLELNVPMVGICRGSQFLCVANGGKLIQDVTDHAIGGCHTIGCLLTGEVYPITSTHHQMQYPFNLNPDEYVIVARSLSANSDHYYGSKTENMELPLNFVEPEIVYYKKSNSLAIQGHPEYMDKNSETVKYLNQLIKDLLLYGK